MKIDASRSFPQLFPVRRDVMDIQVHDFDLHLVHLRARFPFRYGIATMTEVPQLFLRLFTRVDGAAQTGFSAEMLAPRWFSKRPEQSIEAERNELLNAIRHAAAAALEIPAATAFDFWEQLYRVQSDWGAQNKFPPLLSHLGTSLVERALIDALCRSTRRPFPQMVAANGFGIRLGAIHPSLEGFNPNRFLPASPLRKIIVRHTVGLSDPLTDADVAEKVNDGLPQTLSAAIAHYGLRHFKIKIGGDPVTDLARLDQVAALLLAEAPKEFRFSLDANEQYGSIDSFRQFWSSFCTGKRLRLLLPHLLFVEQPLHRDAAFGEEVSRAFAGWPDRPPMIIDESDAETGSLGLALKTGYAGTSHKNCKGVFKGIANRCRLLQLRLENQSHPALMSGEDLSTTPPVGLLQDLAVQATLGIESVERNGHHYFAGLSSFPPGTRDQVLQAHPDLYARGARGWPTLTIDRGNLSVGSVLAAPFGPGFVPDLKSFESVTNK